MRSALAHLPSFLLLGTCHLYEGGISAVADGGVDGALEASVDAATLDASDAADVSAKDAFDTGTPVEPSQIPGLVLWFRADKGVVIDGGVVAWNDSSDAGDPNHNATQTSSALQPGYQAANGNYNNSPTLSFSGSQLLQTQTFIEAQPVSVFVVGNAGPGANPDRHFFDSALQGMSMTLYCPPTGVVGPQMYAGKLPAPKVMSAPCNVPAAIVGIFNGSQSRIYSSTNTPVALDPGTNGLVGATIGNTAAGGPYAIQGVVAEVAVWRVAIDPMSIAGLYAYVYSRYGILAN